MTTYDAPHSVYDEAKLAALVAALERGETLPPIVVNGYTALTGSHRIAACATVDGDLATVECTDEDLTAALVRLDLSSTDEIGDYNAFCTALYDVTVDDELRSALADQR